MSTLNPFDPDDLDKMVARTEQPRFWRILREFVWHTGHFLWRCPPKLWLGYFSYVTKAVSDTLLIEDDYVEAAPDEEQMRAIQTRVFIAMSVFQQTGEIGYKELRNAVFVAEVPKEEQ